jgi:hypothetical protein
LPFALAPTTPLATFVNLSQLLETSLEVLAMGKYSVREVLIADLSSPIVWGGPACEAAPCARRICSTASWRFFPPELREVAEDEEVEVERSPLRYLGWKVQTRKVEAKQAARARARRLWEEEEERGRAGDHGVR